MFLEFILLTAWICFFTMAIAWWISIKNDNASIVDPIWAGTFSVISLEYALFSPGFFWRKLLLFAMVFLWSQRLALHLALRLRKHFPQEDKRYQLFRQKWGLKTLRFFGFFQLQGLSIFILSVPFLYAYRNPSHTISILEWISVLVWTIAWTGETLSDIQLRNFKASAQNLGQVCNAGLWKYSRHPNYFFEWLNWCAFALFIAASPGGQVAFYCPFLMLYLLLRVTGIPLLEQLAIQSKGDLYLRYQKTTPMFFPWFPRSSISPNSHDSHASQTKNNL